MKKIKDLPDYEKPREKLLKRGVSVLNNYELMAVIIGTGNGVKDVMGIAKDVVDIADYRPENLTVERLSTIKGVGVSKACRISASFEFFKRCTEFGIRVKVQSEKDVAKLVRDINHKKQEHFITLTLDGASNLIKKRTVFIGTLNQSLVHPREVFAGAFEDRAAALIAVHNHPSGNIKPSDMDIAITQRLRSAGELLGIEFLDHLIIGGNEYYSFRENMKF